MGKEVSIDLPHPTNMLRLSGVSTAPVTATLDGKLAFIIPEGNFNRRGVRLGKGVLTLKTKGEMDTHYGVAEYRVTEYTDDREIPEPKPPMNILAAYRNQLRQSLGVVREPFDNDTPWPGHEIDDDAPVMFEEEQAQFEREQAKAQKQPVEPAEETPAEGETTTETNT